jgi:hypothetical protein
MTEADFRETLKAGGFDLNDARDGNNNPVFVSVNKRSRYWDKVTLETVQAYGDERRVERTVIKPVTQQVIEFTIKGAGRDGKANTWDDVTLTQVVHVLAEQSRNDIKPAVVMQPIAHRGGGGSIAGTVTDPNDAVVPGVKVTATNEATKLESATTTDENGTYFIGNLVGGTYTVRFVATGFKAYVTNNVKVDAGTTSVDAVLSPGEAATTVDVVSTADPSQTDSAAVSMTITSHQIAELPVGKKSMALLAIRPGVKIVTKPGTQDEQTDTDEQTSTPRLREYFPETLYWSPEIVTSTEGTAEIRFRMADNITTWKMYTIASTKDGRIGVGEKEVAAFQAFFVDLDPPKFLTTGDEIYLPTQVRNYTEKKQDVKVTMSSSDWFTFLDAESKNVAVGSGKSENAVFGFKATSARKDARQRVTAMAETDSDAIERPVTVRPDGREIVQTDSRYFTGSDKFELNFPANAFPDSRSAELKIYPNVMAHVAEAVEGLLRRPYGCGEQTISSTYPNVMILKFASPGEGKPRRVSESVERTARKYLQSGYERLLGYQVADGGFSYWGGKDGADFALTAYALRFLADASRFVEVDPEVIKRAETWLIKQQKADGSWNKKYTWEPKEDEQRAKSTTTFVARTLAMLRASAGQGQADNGKAEALARSLGYLRSRNAELDDPYSLGLFGLAAFDAGDEQLARLVAQKLATLAKIEGGSAYWNLESNTAFNGWGKTGRIETTALVAQLFMKLNAEPELVRKAMLFVFRNKDNYGVWYSTQTTINVLDALVISLASSNAQSTGSVQVLVNGQPVETVRIPADKLDEIVVDLRGKLAADSNTIELRSGDRSPLMTQLVATHYVDWSDTSGRTENQSRALRLDYKCDRSTAAIMQEVSCTVEAERIAYHGYGMLLAEIGTPPGADVSRESLQAAVDADWSISRYDVLPDRIILYMWSKAGGTKLNFKFRPRYGINAKTPASVVYDYYNPEAQATVAPLKFAVK